MESFEVVTVITIVEEFYVQLLFFISHAFGKIAIFIGNIIDFKDSC